MCGIAGELQFGNHHSPISTIERINLRQQHRGPDGEGIYFLDRLTLGHRRLKIFDLSDRGAQPMVDYELGLALVFNGAIYNFHELKRELEAKGYKFVSNSDTEVLMKAYHAWRENCIEKLRGMFSFAIWERETGKLVLARDRLGIKPLYYATGSNGFRFASTPQALLEFGDIDTSINHEALHYYLTFHTVPEPLTILSGIKKLMPGSVMTVHKDGRLEEKRYWELRLDQTDETRSEEEWLQASEEAMMLATRRQLSADVPVGILLSGGLDSSLITALAVKAGHEHIETFSIGFESAGGEKGDEFYYSDIVSKHFGTKHHQLFISNKGLTDSLARCVRAMSEPMVSHDNAGFYLLSKEVANYVKVVLSGQGADEMFAGYHWFQKIGYQQAAAEESASIITNIISDRTYDEYVHTVTPEYRTGYAAKSFIRKLCAKNPSPYILDHLLEYECTFALAGGPLARVDNMTMAASLEARVPFLDEAIIYLATSMPLRYKLPDNGKYMLKKLGRKLVPHEVVDRPKGYFPVPAIKYMKGETLKLMQEVLSPENVRKRGIFNPQTVNNLLKNPSENLTPSGGSKLWQIGLLEFWLQQLGL